MGTPIYGRRVGVKQTTLTRDESYFDNEFLKKLAASRKTSYVIHAGIDCA